MRIAPWTACRHELPCPAMPEKREEPLPQEDGPHEVADAAEQEIEYPADETDEG